MVTRRTLRNAADDADAERFIGRHAELEVAAAQAVGQLEGYPAAASVLEREILPARIADYTPRVLDELGAAGEIGGANPTRSRSQGDADASSDRKRHV